jgi:hypothetical protein
MVQLTFAVQDILILGRGRLQFLVLVSKVSCIKVTVKAKAVSKRYNIRGFTARRDLLRSLTCCVDGILELSRNFVFKTNWSGFKYHYQTRQQSLRPQQEN